MKKRHFKAVTFNVNQYSLLNSVKSKRAEPVYKEIRTIKRKLHN